MTHCPCMELCEGSNFFLLKSAKLKSILFQMAAHVILTLTVVKIGQQLQYQPLPLLRRLQRLLNNIGRLVDLELQEDPNTQTIPHIGEIK